MPLVYQQNINDTTKLGIWHITEAEDFFLKEVPLQREITHPHKRLQHLAGRMLLKELFPDFPYELIRIADTKKPFLENEMYHFSISHCGDYAAVIVSKDCRVGVDIEQVNEKVGRIQHKYLSKLELQKINEGTLMTTDDRRPTTEEQISKSDIIHRTSYFLRMLTLCWSIKESLFKWYGDGGIDFKDHLHIDNINWKESKGRVNCRFTKDTDKDLLVQCFFYEDNCVSFVLTAH